MLLSLLLALLWTLACPRVAGAAAPDGAARSGVEDDGPAGAPAAESELPEAERASAQDIDPPGAAFFAAPLVTFDSVYKLGGGAFGQIVFADPSGVEPFKASFAGQLYGTTGGFQAHYINYDLPAFAGSRLRLSGMFRRVVWTRAPYFGLGGDTPRRRPDGPEDRWHQFDQRRWRVAFNVRRRVATSSWELYAGPALISETITPYPDSMLLLERPQGVGGGNMVWGQVGAFYDTRTNEIDPWDGVTVDLALRTSGPWTLSDWRASGGFAAISGWRAVHPRVVLAGRVLVDGVFGQPPFFTRAYLGGLRTTIVGGLYLLRGLPPERYRGDAIAAGQGELRLRVADARILRGRVGLGFMLVPFVDAAKVAMWSQESELLLPHVTGGGGLRVNVNDLLILRADCGVGLERYVGEPGGEPLLQFYILADHPF